MEVKRGRGRPPSFTQQKRRDFLELLKRNGLMSRCAEAVGVTLRCVCKSRADDPDFDEEVNDALLHYAETLEEEADRRGRDGYDEPVFYKGEEVGTKRKFSDRLLLARLQALKPEMYRNVQLDEQGGGTVKVEVVAFDPAAKKE